MKHVFVVGSHTPYLTSLGVITSLGLNKRDVIFIFTRNYSCSFHDKTYETYDLSNLFLIYYKNSKKEQIKDYINKIDAFISNNLFGEYTLYCPSLNFPFFQVLATNTLCKDIKFIQEGIIDFCSRGDVLKSIYPWIVNTFFLNFGRVWKDYKWNSFKYLNNKTVSETFAISDKLYRNIDCCHTVVKWPKFTISTDLNTRWPIFVFESAVEIGDCDIEVYMEATKSMIERNALDNNYIRFHPMQNSENKKKIIEFFKKKGSSVVELDKSIPFELIIASYNNLTIYGFSTSLIFYSKLMGHKAISFVPDLLASRRFRNYWNKRFLPQLKVYGEKTFVYGSNLTL